ncbi:hypothetical protein BKA69DRAFT_1050410 [Paraphysoderma sedebokerense]|nr:hypothetical protein BKA69DRAFT_1050410 [Paraphysoderma sedebokerense]
MFAAGSGITPMLLLINYYHRFAPRDPANGVLVPKLRLYYQSQSPKDIIYREELESMSKSRPLLGMVHIVSSADAKWNGVRGKVDRSMINQWLEESLQSEEHSKNTIIIICGPDSFNQSIYRVLIDLGVEKSCIRSL